MEKYKYLKLFFAILVLVVSLELPMVKIYAETELSEINKNKEELEINQIRDLIFKNKQIEFFTADLSEEEKELILKLRGEPIKYYMNEDFIIDNKGYSYDIQVFYVELIEKLLGLDIKIIDPIVGISPVEAISNGVADFTTVSDYVYTLDDDTLQSSAYTIEKLYLFGSKESVIEPFSRDVLVIGSYDEVAKSYLDKDLEIILYDELPKDKQLEYKANITTDTEYVALGNYKDTMEFAKGSGLYLIEHPIDIPLKFISKNDEIIYLIEKINKNIDMYDIYNFSRVLNNKKLQTLFLALLSENENKIMRNIDGVFYYDGTISPISNLYESYYYTYIDTLIEVVTGSSTGVQKYKLPDDIMYLSELVVRVVIDSSTNGYNVNSYKTSPFAYDKFDLITLLDFENKFSIYNISELKYFQVGVIESQKEVLANNLSNEYNFSDFSSVTVYDTLDELMVGLLDREIDYFITYPGVYDSLKDEIYREYNIELVNKNYLFHNENWVFETNNEYLTSILDKYILLLENNKFYNDSIISSYITDSVIYENDDIKYKVYAIVISLITCSIMFYLLKVYDIRNIIEKSKIYDQEKGIYSKDGFKEYIKNLKEEYSIITVRIVNYNDISAIYSEEELEELNRSLVNRLKALNLTFKIEVFKISDDEYYVLVSSKNNKKYHMDSKIVDMIGSRYNIFGKNIILNYRINVIESSYIKRDNIPIKKFTDYMCKNIDVQSRKSGVLHFKGYMYPKLIEKIRLEEAISSFDINMIQPFYQPIANVITGEIVGCEAYSGINVDGKIYTATEFIGFLEKINQVKLIDEFLLNIVLTKRNDLLKNNVIDEDFKFSINVSEEFIGVLTGELLEKLCKYHRLNDLSCIIFDISEVSINNKKNNDKFDMMRAYGIKISLETTRVGLAILNAIDGNRVDIVKFEKETVMLQNENIVDIIKEIIKIPRIESICKLVETSEEYSYLKKLGFENLQGYYFSHVKNYDELVEYLKL